LLWLERATMKTRPGIKEARVRARALRRPGRPAERVTARGPHRGPPPPGARARAPKRRGADNASVIGRATEGSERTPRAPRRAACLHHRSFRVKRSARRVPGRDARGPTCPRAPQRSAIRGPALRSRPQLKTPPTAWPLSIVTERPRRGGILLLRPCVRRRIGTRLPS
jgi:hypothetical protein